jgi:hypothetical protein
MNKLQKMAWGTEIASEKVDTIFRLAVGIAVYDEFFSCMCAAEFVCALDDFARHTLPPSYYHIQFA